MSSNLDAIGSALIAASVELSRAEAMLGGELAGEPDPNDFEHLARRVDELTELVAALREGSEELQRALEEAESALTAAQAEFSEAQEDGRDE